MTVIAPSDGQLAAPEFCEERMASRSEEN